MASTPVFASVPRIGLGSVTVANTARDGSGTLVNVLTGVAAGTRIERIVLTATNDPADSTVTMFLFDGTTNWLFDEVDLNNPAAGSATATTFRWEKRYSDLVLPSASWIFKAAITVALTAGAINVEAFGADLT
jgi:hypothetical protein